jgi:hypothetical protein
MRPATTNRGAGGDRAMSATDKPLEWAPDDPILGRMVFVSGTGPVPFVDQLVPAFDLYQGGCVPQLRRRLGGSPAHRARVRFVSAAHGVLHADTQLLPDHRPMTAELVATLRPYVREKLFAEFARDGVPREVLVLLEYPHAQLIIDIFWIPGRRPYTALSTLRPAEHWPSANAVLDRWGWP